MLSLVMSFLSTVLLKWKWTKYNGDTGVGVGDAITTETGNKRYTAVTQYAAMWGRSILQQSEFKS